MNTDDVPVNYLKLRRTDESDSPKAQLCTRIVIARHSMNNAMTLAAAIHIPSDVDDDNIDRSLAYYNLDNAFHLVDDNLVTGLRLKTPENVDCNGSMFVADVVVVDLFHHLPLIAASVADYHLNQLPPKWADYDYCGYVLVTIHYYRM